MPLFAFRATDRMGNIVEGNVNAVNTAFAANEIGQMGYSLLSLNADGDAPPSQNNNASIVKNEVGITIGLAAARTDIQHEEPVAFANMEGSSQPQRVPLTGEPMDFPIIAGRESDSRTGGGAERSAYLEPWERNMPPPSSTTPTLVMNAAGGVMGKTQAMTPTINTSGMPSVYTGQNTGHNRERASDAPYGASSSRKESSLGQRFTEVFVYPIYSGVVMKDLAPFYRQFATLIEAGLPLFQSLVALEANTKNAKLKEVAKESQKQVQAGGRFSDVMAASPWIFEPMQIEMVRAAEQGGMLDQVFRQLAGYVEHDWEIKRLISRETLYPKIVVLFALMIIGCHGFLGGKMAFVRLILSGMGKDEYGLGQYLLDTVGFGLLIAGICFSIYAFYRISLFNTPGVRESVDRFRISIPMIGNIVKMFSLARFGRTFAALNRGGFGMSSALEIAGNASGNAVLREAAFRGIRATDRGELASDGLQQAGFFPPMALDMIRTGETAGRLDEMLDKMSEYYEAEAKMKTHRAAMIFGTGVFLLVAILVAIQVISFYMGYGSSLSGAGGGGE